MPTSLTLNEGLETISAAAFERSGVETVDLPSTVKFLDKDAFRLSSQTVLLLSDKPLDQLPEGVAVYGSGHEVAYFADVWFTDDFTYDGTTVTGLSDTGKEKLLLNQDLVIPDLRDRKFVNNHLARGFQHGNLRCFRNVCHFSLPPFF